MAAAPFALGAGRLYAAPAARDNRLLVVFMRGAYDAASLLVPAASDFYYESRPTIATRLVSLWNQGSSRVMASITSASRFL